MTHLHYGPPASPPSATRPRRSNAEYRWTRPKLAAFLKALTLSGSVAQAARAVGMSRQSAYRLRARLGPGPVLDLWDEARRLGVERQRHKATQWRAR